MFNKQQLKWVEYVNTYYLAEFWSAGKNTKATNLIALFVWLFSLFDSILSTTFDS